jgi:hypothetical protein
VATWVYSQTIDLEPVAATFWVEPGVHGEHGWAFCVKSGSRICQLAVCSFDQSKKVNLAAWQAIATFANFEPKLGKPGEYQLILFCPEEFEPRLIEVVEGIESIKRRPG